MMANIGSDSELLDSVSADGTRLSRSTKTLTRLEVACGAAVASARNPAKERPVMVENA